MKLHWLLLPLLWTSRVSAGEGYPADWVALSNDQGCSGISNVYENRGEMANVNVEKNLLPTLSSLLFQTPNDRIASAKANFVKISLRDSVLYVEALRGAEVLASARYQSIRCKGTWLVLSNDAGMASGRGNVVLGYEKSARMLRSATDGSLVVKSASSAAGLAFFLVPLAGSSTTYMRFQKQQ